MSYRLAQGAASNPSLAATTTFATDAGATTTTNTTTTNTTTTTHRGGTASAAAVVEAVWTQARMGQLLDDQDHKRCSEGNQRALLAENLDQLRGLVKGLEAEDWKYAS